MLYATARRFLPPALKDTEAASMGSGPKSPCLCTAQLAGEGHGSPPGMSLSTSDPAPTCSRRSEIRASQGAFRRYLRAVVYTFPPAQGRRAAWGELDGRVLAALQERFGAEVAEVQPQVHGFSPAVVAGVVFENGDRAFVKAVCPEMNPNSPAMYRTEARAARLLPPEAHAPKLLWDYDGRWVALAFELVDGKTPELPWRQCDLDRVLAALGEIAHALTPSPTDAPCVTVQLGRSFHAWRDATTTGAGEKAIGELALVEPWAARNIERLAGLEASWEEAAKGSTLVHADVRADNVLLTEDGVVFVDWASPCVGAPWLDLLFFLPSVAMQGGPQPAEVFERQPLGARAPRDAATSVLCALTGYFVWKSLQPAPPGLPTLRAFQRAQGIAAAAWLRQRTGWT